MATKKDDHQDPLFDPDAFSQALHIVEGWAGFSASEKELDDLGSHLADSSEAAHTLFEEVNDFASSLAPCLNNAQVWSKTDAQTLALLVCGGEAVRIGARNCAPISQDLPSGTHRLSLYLLLLYNRAAILQIDPAPWARLVVLLWILWSRAVREIVQRCDQHLGIRYGLAAHLWDKPDAEQELRDLLKDIQWLSNKYLSENSQRTIRDRPNVNNTIVPELGSALAHVLDQRKLLHDPLNGLLKALDGKLNVFPEAVANQLTKDLKPIRRYRTIDVDIEAVKKDDASVLDELPADQLLPLDELVQQEELSEHDRLVARMSEEIASLCAQSAKHRVGYEAHTKTKTKVELAAQHRKDPDTIARWEKKFLSALRDRLAAV